MKKLIFIITVIFMLCTVFPAFAAENETSETDTGDTSTATESAAADDDTENSAEIIRLSDGLQGRGNIDDLYKYWETNGYPDYIAYAYEAGGEMLDDDTTVSWWEIGIVNANDDLKQQVLDLASPNTRITFIECRYSHAERLSAYNELTELNDSNISQVIMTYNTENILVAMKAGTSADTAKQYANDFNEKYGSMVTVVDSDQIAAEDTTTGIDGGTSAFKYGTLLLIFTVAVCISAIAAVIVHRRKVLSVQLVQGGNENTGHISRREVKEAINKSDVAPDEAALDEILNKIEKKY